uniref:Predicted protein n=1 Tax=Hordeum vulgare subsp. vulgare TaxID=112509 RepID=F2D084_HORVV|nr:predicted protein [Hordeum vulgare subsp. vulgare]
MVILSKNWSRPKPMPSWASSGHSGSSSSTTSWYLVSSSLILAFFSSGSVSSCVSGIRSIISRIFLRSVLRSWSVIRTGPSSSESESESALRGPPPITSRPALGSLARSARARAASAGPRLGLDRGQEPKLKTGRAWGACELGCSARLRQNVEQVAGREQRSAIASLLCAPWLLVLFYSSAGGRFSWPPMPRELAYEFGTGFAAVTILMPNLLRLVCLGLGR